MTLILTPLQSAITSLAKALAQPKDEFVRDATIQRFEYTYELCWKMMRRRLLDDHGESEVSLLSRRELFRMAADYQLIDDLLNWFAYHKAGNETSHLYDERKAEEVYQIATRFLPDAQGLLSKLEARNVD